MDLTKQKPWPAVFFKTWDSSSFSSREAQKQQAQQLPSEELYLKSQD